MLQLFLSYAHEDADRVRRFWGELKRPGIEPWMDYQLKLAGIWNDEIDERVKTCAFFIPILSKATQDGAGCRFFRKE
jgi:TIR domain